jgi:16S rRNA (uracil1498-N3)-methyltransferase
MTPFYIERVVGETAYLMGEEAHHSIKVLRKKAGDEIIGIDGTGLMLVCKVKALGKDLVEMEIMERYRDWGEKPQRIYLLVSPLHKPDRFEWLVEKAVELGVTDILPYLGKHTVKTGLRVDRLERIMIAALKQCMRSRLPKIHEPQSLKKALGVAKADISLLAHLELGKPIQDIELDWQGAGSVMGLIGPEGDFSQDELEEALKLGFQAVSLGQNRLRSETAAIHILGLIKNYMRY